MSSISPILSLDNVSVTLGKKNIIDHINLALEPGEIVTLIGPNGAGKTTLVRTILGLVKPSSGRIQKRANLRIGYMPQRLHLEKTIPLSVGRFLKVGKHIQQPQIDAALSQAGALHTLDRPMQSISGANYSAYYWPALYCVNLIYWY